jgi:tRNA nucleotidyltransferase (CCA-adding enzyme)
MRTHYGRTIKSENTIKRTLEEEEMEVLESLESGQNQSLVLSFKQLPTL